MPAANKNILIEQGVTFQWTQLLLDGQGANAPAMDLTGYSARMQIRSEIDSALALVTLSSAPGGGILLDGVSGMLEIEISAAATSALNFEGAVYDLELVQPDGKVLRLFKGAVSLSLEVTRL